MSQLRKMKQKAQKEYKSKIKRQQTIFSFFFIAAIGISFLMLILCAINNALTLATTIISGSVWLVFDFVFAYAIKRKWYILLNDCSTDLHYKYNQAKTEIERKKDNWHGNCFKFIISVVILLIHLFLLAEIMS